MQELPYGNENTNESEHKYKSAGCCRRLINCDLQRFALKPKPRKILKALLRKAFKIFLVVRLIGNCCS
jgi:hypothetical protein